ncbi:hypothetical protein G9C98_000383 [Cotesia typhae]|uniref:Uncharacterized protein n=1 Tax=Cotesia typhae TaxID=2053667 RepID=A0A8J5RH01_9HYME|nr:hypothetical protein G9C98_000383 [Cotesia typhae]
MYTCRVKEWLKRRDTWGMSGSSENSGHKVDLTGFLFWTAVHTQTSWKRISGTQYHWPYPASC